jgi:hypothetical protein
MILPRLEIDPAAKPIEVFSFIPGAKIMKPFIFLGLFFCKAWCNVKDVPVEKLTDRTPLPYLQNYRFPYLLLPPILSNQGFPGHLG